MIGLQNVCELHTGLVQVLENLESPEIFYGIFQEWKLLEKAHWSWKVLEICQTQLKDMKCMEGIKEN